MPKESLVAMASCGIQHSPLNQFLLTLAKSFASARTDNLASANIGNYPAPARATTAPTASPVSTFILRTL